MDETDASTSESAPRWRYLPWLLIALVPLVLLAVMIWEKRWISDDGFINLRIVDHVLQGFGPVFNVGERVEAYTSPMWIGILTLLGGLGLRLEHAAVGAGLVGTVVGGGFAIVGAVRAARPEKDLLRAFGQNWCLPLGLGVYAVLPPAWDYGTSGLEMGATALWLGLSFWSLARLVSGTSGEGEPPSRASWYGCAFLLGLGPLVRPELGLFSFGLLVPLLIGYFGREVGEFRLLDLVKLGTAMGAVPVGYEIFRMGYFAAIVPNTALAKSAFGSRWVQGIHYFDNFFGFYELLLPLSILLIFWVELLGRSLGERDWMRFATLLMPSICGLAYGIYVLKVGGGFMHGRLFLPPLFGFLLPVAAIPLHRRGGAWSHTAGRVWGTIAIVVWMLYCGTTLRIPKENEHGIGDERGWYARVAQVEHPVESEDYEKMKYHRDASRLREIAAARCVDDSLPDTAVGIRKCDPVVRIDQRNDTDFGRLFPDRTEYPMRESVAERGIVMAVMRTAMGIRGNVLGPRIHLVDHVGLADPFAARLALEHRGRPGHEKDLTNPWIVARFSPPERGEDYRISAARRALDCGMMRELRKATRAPMTIGRFIQNLGLAFSLHSFRFSGDPWEAEEEVCDLERTPPDLHGGSGGVSSRWYCPVGYVLSGLRAHTNVNGKHLGRVEPQCRPLALEEGRLVIDRRAEVRSGPGFGRERGPDHQTLDCPEGGVPLGYRGRASGFVHGLEPVCTTLDLEGEAETVDDVEDVTIENPRSGEFFGRRHGGEIDLTCPEGEVPRGLHARSGTLIDALGIACAPPEEIAGAELEPLE